MAKTSKTRQRRIEPDRTRAVVYARVSSKEQDREGFSIPAQLKLLNEYAITNGMAVAREFIDVETAKASGRTSFNEMLRFLDEHPGIGTILVEKTDRLYRNLKDWVTLDDLDLEIHLVKEGVVLSSDSRSSEKFMHGIKVLMAKNYIDNLSEEVRKGMLEKAEQGLWPSAAPLGYLNVEGADGKKIIVPDPKLAPLVQKLYEWYSTGQYSLRAVSKKAREAGLAYRKSGTGVSMATAHKILRNRIYTGTFDWNGHRYDGSYQALIDIDLWNAVQDVLDGRNASKLRSGPRDFPFSGVMKCGHCGCAMVGEIKKRKYVYYHCTGFKGKCGEPYVREEVLEEKFAALLGRLRLDDEVFDLIRRALKESEEERTRDQKEARARIQAEHDRLQDRMMAMYVDKLDGKITENFYTRLQATWRDERKRCLADLARFDDADDSQFEAGLTILRLGQEAAEALKTGSPTQKRNLLNYVLSNCTWANGELTADFNEPFDLLDETLAQTHAAAPTGDGEAGYEVAKGEKWLPGPDSNQRPSG
jgi:site-specific DNA recombinase